MNAFGAVIPGNERWWHTANERMKIVSAAQMTKLMADGMQEMARYTGPAGARVMWADIPGLDANRADLDLLDVTIGTYRDAWDTVLPGHLGKDVLFAATSFNIPMWNTRGNNSPSAAAYAAGHGTGGVYLPLDDPDFVANTFVLPMRLEFKVTRPADTTAAEWNFLKNGGYQNFSFKVLKGGNVVPLTLPNGQNGDKFFYKRVSAFDPNSLYVSVNLAITDASYQGVTTTVADSKTDLYSVNPTYLASNPNPFPERGAKEQRGFFLFGDGSKDAEFTSPEAIYVTLPVTVQKGCAAAPAVANAILDSIGFKGGRGNVNKAVAHEMGSHPDDTNGSMFWGIEQCRKGAANPYYEAAVKSFLRTRFGLNV
jgi:hypothetical protein